MVLKAQFATEEEHGFTAWLEKRLKREDASDADFLSAGGATENLAHREAVGKLKKKVRAPEGRHNCGL